MDWMVWCLAGEHLRDMEDQHVIWTVGDPHLSDDGLRDSELQGWRPTNFEAGAVWAFGAGKSGDLLVDF